MEVEQQKGESEGKRTGKVMETGEEEKDSARDED